MKGKRRVFLLGLDGGDLLLVNRFCSAGALPNFARVLGKGFSSDLESTIPNSTPPAWTSIMTGKNPGKHGVYWFMRRRPGTYRTTWSVRDPGCKSIFRLLSDAGRKVVSIDVPLTYPPEEVSGAMVSGLGTPDVGSPFVHPPEMKKDVLGAAKDYIVDVVLPDMSVRDENEVERFEAAWRKHLKQRVAIADLLFDRVDWDFFMLVFSCTDRVSHAFWAHMDETHPRYPGETRHKGEILACYKAVDEYLGSLLARFGEETTLIVCSDHGSRPNYGGFNLVAWLKDEGFIPAAKEQDIQQFAMFGDGGRLRSMFTLEKGKNSSVVPRPGSGEAVLETSAADAFSGLVLSLSGLQEDASYELSLSAQGSEAGMHFELIVEDSTASKATHYRSVAKAPGEYGCRLTAKGGSCRVFMRNSSYGGNPIGSIAVKGVSLKKSFDWRKCTAYPGGMIADVVNLSSQAIFLNLEGREPLGTVRKEDYLPVRDKMAESLRSLRCEKTGKPFLRVFTREELYHGDKASEAPDVVFVPDVQPGMASKYITVSAKGWTGIHRHYGILLGYGKGLVPSKQAFQGGRVPSVVDIAPTVLSLLGVAVPDDMDGKPLFLAEGAQQPVLPAAKEDEGAAAALSTDDDKLLEKRLRDLGYLG